MKIIKKFARYIIRENGWLRKIIYKLYNVAYTTGNPEVYSQPVEIKTKASEKSIFTDKGRTYMRIEALILQSLWILPGY